MLKPFRDFLIVRPLKSALSSIIEVVQQDDKDHPNMEGRAIVIRVGPGLKTGRKYQRKGIYGPLEVNEGDLIAYEGHKYYPTEPGTDNLILQVSDCIVIDPEEPMGDYLAKENLTPVDGVIFAPVGKRTGIRSGEKRV